MTDELEQAAHMTDAEAVRRVFDERNALMVAMYATVFAVVDAGSFMYRAISKTSPPLAWLVALVMFFASAAMAWTMTQLVRSKRDRPIHRLAVEVARNLSDWIVGYLLVQLAAFAYTGGTRGAVVWGSLMPWMILGLRFSIVRRSAVHASLFAIAVALAYFHGVNPKDHIITAIAVPNAIATLLGGFNSRRIRQSTVARWTERRASAREQLRMRDELRYAREIQLSMLPESAPQVDWADIAGVSIPATEVGGDYFDYIDADGSLAIVCGDVAGHGLASGITLSALRGGLTLLRHSFANPAAVLERLQEVVTESSRRRTLVTLTAILFDPIRKTATIANAGHPPVLIRRNNGNVESIELFGPPLGVRRSEPVPQREVAFENGDVFVLHSDGVYETVNERGEQFGLERLATLIASSDGSAAGIRDAVLRSVEQFRSNTPQQDDVTVVVVKITAPGQMSDRSSPDR